MQLRQITRLYSNAFEAAEERALYIYGPLIVRQVCSGSMLQLYRGVQQLGIQLEPDLQRRADRGRFLAGAEGDTVFTDDLKMLLPQLWRSDAFQRAHLSRNLFQLVDNLDYFLIDFERVSSPDYVPSVDDVFRVRNRTSGNCLLTRPICVHVIITSIKRAGALVLYFFAIARSLTLELELPAAASSTFAATAF